MILPFIGINNLLLIFTYSDFFKVFYCRSFFLTGHTKGKINKQTMIRILVIHSIKVNFSLNKNALFQNKKFKCIYVNFYGALNLAINYDLVG